MKHLLPPDAWRSEAFAEDLFAEQHQRHVPSPAFQFGRINAALIGLLPVALAAGGALLAVLSRTA